MQVLGFNARLSPRVQYWRQVTGPTVVAGCTAVSRGRAAPPALHGPPSVSGKVGRDGKGMAEATGANPVPVKTLVTVVRRWTRGFLQTEMGLSIHDEAVRLDRVQRIDLQDLTSIVGVGGPVNMFIAFSFDTPLVDHVTTAMTEGLDVEDMDPADLRQDAAGEVINTIIGNSTSDFQGRGETISLSPPVTLDGAKSVFRSKNAVFCTVRLKTDHGALDLDFIGPRDYFDEHLNYLGDSG